MALMGQARNEVVDEVVDEVVARSSYSTMVPWQDLSLQLYQVVLLEADELEWHGMVDKVDELEPLS